MLFWQTIQESIIQKLIADWFCYFMDYCLKTSTVSVKLINDFNEFCEKVENSVLDPSNQHDSLKTN